MSKKRKKGTYKKASHSEFLLQLIYLMKRFWLNEENVLPWLANRLQQFTHFPLSQNQSSVGSWIFVRRKRYLSLVVSTVIYESLSTIGLCTYQRHLAKAYLSLKSLNSSWELISLHKKKTKQNKKNCVQSNSSHRWYKPESHHIWKKQNKTIIYPWKDL